MNDALPLPPSAPRRELVETLERIACRLDDMHCEECHNVHGYCPDHCPSDASDADACALRALAHVLAAMPQAIYETIAIQQRAELVRLGGEPPKEGL